MNMVVRREWTSESCSLNTHTDPVVKIILNFISQFLLILQVTNNVRISPYEDTLYSIMISDIFISGIFCPPSLPSFLSPSLAFENL